MGLPRFFSRVADSLTPISGVDRDALAGKLDDRVVQLVIAERVADSHARTHGARLAANLLARIYPRIHLAGPAVATGPLGEVVLSVNPSCDVTAGEGTRPDVAATLHYGGSSGGTFESNAVMADASGMNVLIDVEAEADAHSLAGLASAACGVAEIFRVVFAAELGAQGRAGPQPGAFNLVTTGPYSDTVPTATPTLHLEDTYLVGAGAVGQACLLALSTMDVTGKLTIVDPEVVELSNLQRYVLTTDADVGSAKTSLAARALRGTAVVVDEQTVTWGEHDQAGQRANAVLVALDSAAGRLDVATSLPRSAYNAWTQPDDLGWSRHELFGEEPCLACLYYPQHARLSDHEVIGRALNQHPLRVLAYLTSRQPIGQPLPQLPEVPDLAPPADAEQWHFTSLLQDLLGAGAVAIESAPSWESRNIADLYREGVCGGGILTLGTVGSEAVVPLAHQSALAGIMLATVFVASQDDALRAHLPHAIEARIDVQRGLPQVLARPRERSEGCFCSDDDYLALAQQ